MPEIVLHQGPEQTAISFGEHIFERVADEGWLFQTRGGQPVPHDKLTLLLERIAKNPEKLGVVVTHENLNVAEQIEARVARFDAQVFQHWAQRREATIKIGHALIKLKHTLGYGKFQDHIKEVFAPIGLKLRTAQRYMRRAKRAEAEAENDKLSLSKSASDDGAKDVKRATKRAGDSSYKLPLVSLNSQDRKAVEALQKTSNWAEAEESIAAEVRRQCIKFGAYAEEDETDHENSSADA